ncbi:MAG: protein-glutamate methylesterase/protein-glutamine glutaminase [Halothermotrichaceae bacterium]
MIKILVVDDSAFMRQMFVKMLDNNNNFSVIDTAENGQEALKKIKEQNPDVITLDIEMPVKNGLETLKEIMTMPDPVPTIMVSAIDDKDTVMTALELGAFDFIPKPARPLALNLDNIKDDLIEKLQTAAGIEKKSFAEIKPEKPAATISKSNTIKSEDNFPIITIGTSSGGPKALKTILPVLPADFPAAILIVQHMPKGFTSSLAKRLDDQSAITVKEADDNDKIKTGTAYLAPGDYHMEVDENGSILLNQSPPKWSVRPCADYLLTSAAKNFKNRVIGVILTGMGFDGADGMQIVKKYNGYGIVEDKSTALVYGMPQSVIKANAYDEIVPLNKIANKIIEIIERRYS